MPLALVLWSDTSVMMEYASETLPLVAPPTTLANTKTAKLLAAAHSPYEHATPTYVIIIINNITITILIFTVQSSQVTKTKANNQ